MKNYEKFTDEELKDIYIMVKNDEKINIEIELEKRGLHDFIYRQKNKNFDKIREQIIIKKAETLQNNFQMIKKFFIIIVGIIITIVFLVKDMPKPSGYYYEKLNFEQQPLQINLTNSPETLTIKGINTKKFRNLSIVPKAEYKITARVASKKRYYDGAGDLANYDYALVWGKYANTDYMKKVKYRQNSRWFLFQTSDTTLSVSDILRNSANTHLIASNKNINKAIKKVKKNSIVSLEGYLVYVKWDSKHSHNITWNSSLTREDSGDGACEILYVTKIYYKNKVYE